jgi:hypothetical protein
VYWATRTLPATETPIPSEMSRKTIGKPKVMAARASLLSWPSQKVSARL